MYIFIPEPYKKRCVFIYTSSRGTSMFHTAIAPSAEQETNCLDSWRYRRACTFSLKENQKSFQYLYLNYWTISIIQYVAWGTTSANWLEVIWMVDHSKQNSSVLVQAEIHYVLFFFLNKNSVLHMSKGTNNSGMHCRHKCNKAVLKHFLKNYFY